jgi:DNA invertase Pin-like site-specific DNA recombinase
MLFSKRLRQKGTAMAIVGYARVSSVGQSLDVQLERLKDCDKIFKEKRSGVDTGRPALKQCLEFLRDGDTLLVTKIDRLARSTSDLYRIVSELAEKGASFKVLDDPSIDTSSRTGKLVMGILALIAEFENDIRRERQMDGIAKAKDRGVKFGRKRSLTEERAAEIRALREAGETVPAIIKRTGFSKASIYRALG